MGKAAGHNRAMPTNLWQTKGAEIQHEVEAARQQLVELRAELDTARAEQVCVGGIVAVACVTVCQIW